MLISFHVNPRGRENTHGVPTGTYLVRCDTVVGRYNFGDGAQVTVTVSILSERNRGRRMMLIFQGDMLASLLRVLDAENLRELPDDQIIGATFIAQNARREAPHRRDCRGLLR